MVLRHIQKLKGNTIFSAKQSYQKYLRLFCIIALVIGLLLLAYFLYKYFHKSMLIPQVVSGMDLYTFRSRQLPLAPINGGIEYTFQFWIYINSWSYKYGTNKTIIYWKGKQMIVSPERILSECKQVLNPESLEGEGLEGEQSEDGSFRAITDKCAGCPPNPLLESFASPTSGASDLDATAYDAFWRALGSNSSDVGGLQVNLGERTNTLNLYHTMINGKVDATVVPDLPLQKWLNVMILLQQRNLDVFVNAKLVRSKHLPAIPDYRTGRLHVNPKGGFDGYISRLNYTPRCLRLSEIVSEFNHGPSNINDVAKKQSKKESKETPQRESDLSSAEGKCTQNSDCRSDLQCIYDTCQFNDNSRKEGETCLGNSNCNQGLLCNNKGQNKVTDTQIQYLTRQGIPATEDSTWNARLGGRPSTCIQRGIKM